MGVPHRECAHVLTVVFLSGVGRMSTDPRSPPVRLSGMQRFMREGPWIRSASLKVRMGVTVTAPCSSCVRNLAAP